MRVLVTGCVGYIGVCAAEELVLAGHQVRGLDVLLHGQGNCVAALDALEVPLILGDVRDSSTRALALHDVDAVVHLAAIVGDPACARDPVLSAQTNVDASIALADDAAAHGVARFVFASTCSNYGRMSDPMVPIDETGALSPVSLYAEQKVAVEEHLLALRPSPFALTCLRFATVYGVAPRMRFDLTVNEFTRDLWAGRTLEVFGEQFWRPYVHVRDAARAIAATLAAPDEQVAGEVFNVGDSAENYRKLDLVAEIRRVVDRGEVVFVSRDEDPRDYKVSFDKISTRLGSIVTSNVAAGVVEVVEALESGAIPQPFDPRHRNSP